MSVVTNSSNVDKDMDDQEADVVRRLINEYGVVRVLGAVTAEIHSISEQADDEGESNTALVCDTIIDRIWDAIDARKTLVTTDMKF